MNSANSDSKVAGYVPVSGGYVFNGTTWDRWRIAGDSSTTGIPGVQPTGHDAASGTLRRLRTASRDNENTESVLASVPMLFNGGSSLDRQRGVFKAEALASAARTAAALSSLLTNWNHAGVVVTFDITAASGTGGVYPVIYGRDGSNTNTLWNDPASAPTAVGRFSWILYPGISATKPTGAIGIIAQANSVLPRNFYIQSAHLDASSYTYSVQYSLV